jgi:Nup133 N terminal like
MLPQDWGYNRRSDGNNEQFFPASSSPMPVAGTTTNTPSMTPTTMSTSVLPEFYANLRQYWTSSDFGPLQHAGRAVVQELRQQEDEQGGKRADLYRRLAQSGSGTHLYFNSSSWHHVQSTPLPPFVTQQLQEHATVTSTFTCMGLLPEAQLAYVIINHTVYLWSFNNNSTFLSYAVPSQQTVLSVGIVRPRSGTLT